MRTDPPSGRVLASARRVCPVRPGDLPESPGWLRGHLRSLYRAHKGNLDPALAELARVFPEVPREHHLWLLADVVTTGDDLLASQALNRGKIEPRPPRAPRRGPRRPPR